jgi:di/tricarboxylate transporter
MRARIAVWTPPRDRLHHQCIVSRAIPALTLLCVYSLGLMGVISPYATGPAPMYFGSGYIGKGAFWKFGLIFGLIYFAGLLLIVLPWLQLIG